MSGSSGGNNNKEDGGWIESIDHKSGRTFYANRYTRTTQWEAPPGWKGKSNINNAAASANSNVAGRNNSLSTESNSQQRGLLSSSNNNSNNDHNNVTPLPEGWEEMVDPNSGRTFYIDHVNQITTWERPRGGMNDDERNNVTSATAAAAANTERNYKQHSSSLLQQQMSQQQQQYDQSNNNNHGDNYYNTASVMTLNQHGSHSHWDDNPRSGSRNNNNHHSQSITNHALSSTAGPPTPPQLDFTVLTIPNPLRQHCPSCSNPFSYTRRKHHCRLCGDIFCDACSNNRSILPLEGDEYDVPVRICDVCMRDVKRGNYFSLRRYLTCLELYIDDNDEGGKKKEDGGATEQQQQQQMITLDMVAASLSSLLTDIEAMLLEPITSFSTKMTISANILVPAVARHLKRRKTGEYAVWVLATLLQLGNVVGDDSFALAVLGIVSEDVGVGGNGDDDDGGVNGEEKKLIKSESTSNIVLTVDQQQQQQQSSKNYVKNILKILEWNGNDIRTLSAQEQAVKVIYYITDPDLIANALSMKDSLQEEDEGPVDVDAVADTMKQDEKNEEFIHIDIHRAFRSMLDHAMSSDSPSLQRWATACLSHLIAEDQRRACRVEHSSSSSSSTKKKYESFTSQLVSTGGVMILCSLLNSDDGETRAHATSALEAIVIATREIGLALQPSSPKKGRGFSRVGRGTEHDSAIVDAISNIGGSSLPALAHLLISADESVSMMGCSFILSLISPLLTDPRGSGRALQQCSYSSTSSGVGLSFEVKEDGLSSYRNAAIAMVVGDDTLQGDVSCLPSLIAIVRSGVEDTSSWGGGSKARPLKVRAKAAECLAAVALAVGHVIGINSEQSSYDSTYMKAKSALEVMEHERMFDVALQIITSDSHRSLDPSRDTPASRLREAAGLILLALSSSSIVSCSYLMSNGAVSTLLTIASESRMLNTPSSVRGKWASKGLCFLEAATTLLIRAWKTEHETGATSSSSSQSLNLLIETINSGAVEMASRLVKTKVTLKSHDLAYSQLRVKIAICFMLSSIFGMANNQNNEVGLSRLYSAIDADCAQFLATSGGEDIGVRADLVGATLNLLNATLPYAHQFTKEDADEPLPMIDLSEACLLAVGSMCGLADPIGEYSRFQRNDINNAGKYSHIRLDTATMACNILTSMKPNQAALLPTVLVGVIGESLIVPTLRLASAICQFGNNDVCGELSRSGVLVPVGDILQRALASSDCYTAMISVALIRSCGQFIVGNGASGTVETLKGAIQTLTSVLTLPETQNDTSLGRHRSMLKYESLVALEALSANDTLQSTIATNAIPALVSFLQQLESSRSYSDEIESEDAVFIALVTIQKTISVPSNSSIQSMMNNGIISILVNIFEKREEVKNKRIQEVALQIIQSIAQSNMESRYWLTCSGMLRSILSMLGESKATVGTAYVGLNIAGLFLSDLKPSMLTHLEPSKKGELLQQYLNIFCSQRDFVRRLIATISDDCQAFGHPFVFPEDYGVARDVAADVLFHIFSLLLLHGQSSHFDDAIMLNDVSGNAMNVATACSALIDLFSDYETNSGRAPSNPEDRSYYSDVQLPTVKSHLIEALSTSLNQALSSSSKTDAERLIKKLKLPRTCLVLCRSDKLAESAFRLFEEVVLSLSIDFVGDLILCDRVALVTLFDLVTGQANKVPDLEYSKQTFAKLLGNLAKAGLLPKAVDSFGVRSHAIAALSAAMVINGEDENIDDDEDSIQRICIESLVMVLRDEEDQIKLSSVESRALASALGKMLSSTVLARFFTQANLEATINDATVDFGLNRSAICQSAEARLLCAMAHFPESLEIVSRVGGLEAVGLIAHEGEIGAVEAVMKACEMNPQLVVDVEAHLSIMDALVGTEDKLSSSSTKTNFDVVVKCLEIVTTLSICDDTRDSILNADQSGCCMKIASNIVTANAKLKCDSKFDAETSGESGTDLAARNLAEKLIATSIDDQDLQIGNPVLVDSISSKSDSSPKKAEENTHEELEGVIAFMGPVQFAPGDDWIGIHLTGSSIGKGRNDGSVKGVHYFDCEEKSGVFVKRTHVRKRVMDLKSKECDSVEISLPEPVQQPTNPWDTMLVDDNPRLEKASFALLQSFSRSKRHRDAMMNNNEFTTTLAAAVRSSSTTFDFKRDALELLSSFTIHYCEPKEDLITLFCDVIESQTRTLQLSRDRQEQSSSKQLIGIVMSGLQNLLCGCQNAQDQTRPLRVASDLFIFLCNTLFSGPKSRRTTALKTDGALFATLTSILLLSFGSEDIRKSIFTTQHISSLIRFIMMTSRVETMDCHVAFYNKDGEEYWEAANAQCLQILTYIVNMTTQVHLDTTFACLIGECEPSINSFSMCLQSISNRAHGGSSQVWARQLLAKLERLS